MERAVEQTYLPMLPSLETAQPSSKDRLDPRFSCREGSAGREPSGQLRWKPPQRPGPLPQLRDCGSGRGWGTADRALSGLLKGGWSFQLHRGLH